MKKSLLIALPLLLSLIGCVSTTMIKPEERVRLSKICINEIVEVNEKMIYAGPGATFGVIGLLAESSASTDEKIKALASANNIHIDQMAKNEFKKVFSKSERFTLTVKDASDAMLSINIKQYGLNIKHGFSNKLGSLLCLVANLKNSEGKIIWQQIGTSGKNEEYFTLEELFEDPERLRRIWETAVANGVEEVINKL